MSTPFYPAVGGRFTPFRPRTLPTWLGFCFCLGTTSSALAQHTTIPVVEAELKAITVTATNFRETQIDEESKPVSVIGKAAISTRQPTSIVEAMAEAPGVSFSRAGGLGGQMVLRGFNSNDLKSPLAINGERFRGRNTLEYNLIDPSLVESVEIIRGPAAAIYGSEAMAGMVNIVTRKVAPDFSPTFGIKRTNVGVGYETVNHLKSTHLAVEASGKGFDLQVSGSYRDADSYDTPRGVAVNSQFRGQHLNGVLGYSFDKDNRLELRLKSVDVTTHRAGGLGGAPGMAAPIAQRVYLREDPIEENYVGLGFSGKPNWPGVNKLDASLYTRKLNTDVVTTRYPSATSVNETHRYVVGPKEVGGKVMVVSDVVKDAILTAGLDFFSQDWAGAETETKGTGTVANVARKKVESDAKTTGVGLFALLEHEVNERLSLSGNLRHDRYHTETTADVISIPALTQEILANKDAKDNKTTYALGAIFKASDWLSFAANAGTSFRAPTTGEKFSYGTYGKGYLLPNPSLKPEEGKTVDLTMRLRWKGFKSNITVYNSRYTNLIAQQELTYLGLVSSRRVNIGRAEVKGVEIDLAQQLGRDFTLKATTAYTQGTNLTSGKPLSYIAPLVGQVGLAWNSGAYSLEGSVRLSRKKTRIDSALERATAGYGVANLYGSVGLNKLNPSWPKATLRFGIENLFDKTYVNATTREAIASPVSYTNPLVEPGRNFKISLNTEF